ncbi:MAG TPA: hypothetical protein VF989_13735 [Polyangiaceae bacterium]|jgi:hypothetical protein
MRALLKLVNSVTITLLLFSCASIVGIEDAELDPEFEGTGGQAGGGVEPALCDVYCDTVLENCTDEHRVYTSRAICLVACESMDPGEEGDDEGNTVQCRLLNAMLAEQLEEPDVHCPIAGPGGDGVCGENCDGFCTVAMPACPDVFEDTEECLDECNEEYEDLGGYDVSQMGGPTVQCLLYHASAATVGPNPHCLHVAGDGPC